MSEIRMHGPDEDCPACYECPGSVLLMCSDCRGGGIAATRTRRKPATDHARCEHCGWTLYESLTGELRCVHAVCTARGTVAGVLPRELGALDPDTAR